jgi:hypothetical protein
MLIKSIKRNISNIPGWKTNRKLIVIESDDWGSIRTKDRASFESMKAKGLNVDRNHYNSFESLETNEDLELLFDLLMEFKDWKQRYPVFTSMCIMGNPDFEKIQQSDFQTYFFQPLHKTINEYTQSNKILELWKEGKKLGIFIPEIHGREHINVRRYMEILKDHECKDGLRFALEKRSIGASAFNNIGYPNYLGALHPKAKQEIIELEQYIIEAGELFNKYLGYAPRVFIAPNAEEPKSLERSLQFIGVKYLTRSKKRIYPLGDGEFAYEWNFMGKKNEYEQIVLNRNAFFEPVCFGEHEHITDWVDSCLQEINIAFRWGKPAVISSHRVNYVGSISPDNRNKGLNALRRLLSTVLKKWPDVEFLSSFELGELIRTSNKNILF